jgi:hypothetical protein
MPASAALKAGVLTCPWTVSDEPDNRVGVGVFGQGKGLKAEKPAPFRALFRLLEQQGDFSRQSHQIAASDRRVPVRVDSGKDREGLARDGKEPVEITRSIEGPARWIGKGHGPPVRNQLRVDTRPISI